MLYGSKTQNACLNTCLPEISMESSNIPFDLMVSPDTVLKIKAGNLSPSINFSFGSFFNNSRDTKLAAAPVSTKTWEFTENILMGIRISGIIRLFALLLRLLISTFSTFLYLFLFLFNFFLTGMMGLPGGTSAFDIL